jgi:hypothetical protein
MYTAMEANCYALKWAIRLFCVIAIIFNLFLIINLVNFTDNFTSFSVIFKHELHGPANTVFCSSIPVFPAIPSFNLVHRDKKGRFRSPNQEERLPLIPLTKEIMDPLVGNLLGDGSLRFTHKGVDGKPKPGCNANYVMTLKRKDYTYHLWGNIYSTICTSTLPRP